jgi:hypothetical protein
MSEPEKMGVCVVDISDAGISDAEKWGSDEAFQE